MDTRLRASPRHGGAGEFFKLFVPDPPRGRPFAGRRRSSYREECEKNLVSYLNSSIFMGKCSIPGYTLKGVSPPPLWLPQCDKPPDTCYVIIAQRRGGLGAGTVPSVIVPAP